MRLNPPAVAALGLGLLLGLGVLARRAAPDIPPADLPRVVAAAAVAGFDDAGPDDDDGLYDRPESCLALAMYWEARGDGPIGMAAVGGVVLNRAADRRFPDHVCGVVTEGGPGAPCQFAWYCDGRTDRPREAKAWRDALYLTRLMLDGRVTDPSDGALYFLTPGLRPVWTAGLIPTARIGGHVFYR